MWDFWWLRKMWTNRQDSCFICIDVLLSVRRYIGNISTHTLVFFLFISLANDAYYSYYWGEIVLPRCSASLCLCDSACFFTALLPDWPNMMIILHRTHLKVLPGLGSHQERTRKLTPWSFFKLNQLGLKDLHFTFGCSMMCHPPQTSTLLRHVGNLAV